MKVGTSRFLIYVSQGKGDDAFVGLLADNQGNDLVDFEFSVEKINGLGRELRKRAREWAAAFELKDETQEPMLWLQLHEFGAKCFNAVFGDRANDVQATLATAGEDIQLWLKQRSPEVTMPWGLLCNPAEVPTPTMPCRPRVLWAGKYNLVVTLQECGRLSLSKQSPWSFAPVLCEFTYSKGIGYLSTAAKPLAAIIQEKCLDPKTLCKSKRAVSNCFLYVHAHAEEGDLIFGGAGDRSKLSPTEIVRSLVSEGGAAVAVLNACETVRAVRSLGADLMLSTNNREVASIATEIDVHQHFAMQFGLELIDRCVQRGESTIDAMMAMRRKHYPLSVIYSHYCRADHASNPPLELFDPVSATTYRQSIENVNFSDDL